MSRDLPTGMSGKVSAAKLSPIFLVSLDWPSGMVYAWSGYGDIVWNGNTYVGTGQVGTISEVRESRDGAANGAVLSLSGIPSSEIAHSLEDNSQGRSGKIWLGLLTAAGALDGDPYLLFDGFIDVCPSEDSGDSCTISVKLEKELIDARARGRRYTHEDQQIDYPGDLGFEFVAGLADKQVTWGTATAASSGATPGSGVGSGGGNSEME